MKITATINYRNSSLEDKLIVWKMVQEVWLIKPDNITMKFSEMEHPQISLPIEIILPNEYESICKGFLFKLGREMIKIQSVLSLPIEVILCEYPYELNYEYIEDYVCRSFMKRPEQLQSITRKRETLQVRQTAVTFGKMFTKHSLQELGDRYPGRSNGHIDHATILSNIKTINNLRETDKQFAAKFNAIEEHFLKLKH